MTCSELTVCTLRLQVNLDGYALPIKKLKGTEPVESLDLSNKRLGVASAIVIASLIGVNGALTVTNLLGNELDAASAKMLAEVAKQKGISLCGIRRDQTTADFRNKRLQPPDAILLASDLSQAVVTGALTVTNLLGNELDAASAKMLADVAKQKGISLCGIRRDQTTADFRNKRLQPPDAILLASDLSQAVVTGALTVTNLLGNKLDMASAKMLADVAKQKGISLCGIRRDQTTANFSSNFLVPPDAILLASDLSQAIATGALTQVLAFCSPYTSLICYLTHAFALNGIAAGTLKQ